MRKSVRRSGREFELTIRRALEPTDYPFFDYRRFSFALGIAAAGRIWLSGSTAVRFAPPSGMVVEGDLLTQASVIHDKMAVALAAAKRGLGDVVRLVRYVTPKAMPDLAALDACQHKVFGDQVSVSTVPVRSLLRAEALIEIEAVADDGGVDGLDYLPSIVAFGHAEAWAMAAKELRARGLDHTRVKKATELMAMSAFDDGGKEPAGDFPYLRVAMPRLLREEAGVQLDVTLAPQPSPVIYVSMEADPAKDGIVNQCRDLYARLGDKLATRGVGVGSVVKTTEFITPAGLRDYRGTAEVRRDVFSGPYPAATGVICERLGRSGAMIAVEATAVTEAG
jgi:enamine deaminase RidA (YjgF/YER057c/UK114 family)